MTIFQKPFLITSFSVWFSLGSFNPPSILEIVNEWNRMTISSLETQYRISTDKTNKIRYKDILSTAPLYLGYEKGISSRKSIRYGLIKDILSKKHKNFYIAETIRSGEQVEIVSYLIIIGNKSTSVIIYDYVRGKWVPSSEYQTCIIKFSTDLREEIVKWDNGINKDDVVLSKFVSGKIVSSEYYLDHTLSGGNGLDKVLKMRSNSRKY